MCNGPLILRLVLILISGIWLLQGVDVLGGSVMTGQSFWATVGGILLLTRLVSCAYALRGGADAPPQ
jgi:hypothetical protein